MGRRSSGPKPKKRKKVTVQLIKRNHAGEVTEPYRIMDELLNTEHGHLHDATIGMAWRMGWRADTDGHLMLGQCRKRGDLDRELDKFDFIILLNREAWPTLSGEQKRALIDHELCHAAIVMDADGEAKRNDRGQLVTRIRKHDMEEFRAIVQRHGLWTADLEQIARASINDAGRPLLKAETPSGEASQSDVQPNAGPNAESNGDAWRSLPIDELGLSESQADKLREKCQTLGELSDLMAAKGDWWPKEFIRIQRAKVDDAWAAFWKRWQAPKATAGNW